MHVPKDALPWAWAWLARVGEAVSVPSERAR